jgi:hypothetical protein
MSGIGDIYAYKFYDSQDNNYYIDPGHAGISVNVAGQIIGAGNANIGGIAINASNKEVSGVGDLYAYKFYDSQDSNYYIDPGHGTLSIKVAGGANIAGININASNKEVSGVGDLYAYKFIDSQTGSHYVDPGHSTLSAVFAGRIRMVVPTYADDTAAGNGGLVAGDVYKTSGGDLKIKL